MNCAWLTRILVTKLPDEKHRVQPEVIPRGEPHPRSEAECRPIRSSKYGKPVLIHHTIPCDKAISFIVGVNKYKTFYSFS